MSVNDFKNGLISKYIDFGEEKFYRSIIFLAIQKLILIEKGQYKGILPHLEYLEYYDRFIILYRREGDEVCLDAARTLRKAAHKIYRIMLKKNMSTINYKFLNLV